MKEPKAIIGGDSKDVADASLTFECVWFTNIDEVAEQMVDIAVKTSRTVIAWYNDDMLVATPTTRASWLTAQWFKEQMRRDYRSTHPNEETPS